MFEFADKQVLVAGSGPAVRAACALLVQRGAKVSVCSRVGRPAGSPPDEEADLAGVRRLRDEAECLAGAFDLAVLGPEVPVRLGLGQEYHDLGPLLSQRVKRAFLFGAAGRRLRAAWSLFTPCTLVRSLLEAVERAAEHAVPGDVVLLSPACSGLDLFQNPEDCGEAFREAVRRGAARSSEPPLGARPDGGGFGDPTLERLNTQTNPGPGLHQAAARESEENQPT